MKSVEGDIDLLTSLGVSITPTETRMFTPREERILAGFEEIVTFRRANGREPQHDSDDIFERLYAVRLDRLRALEDCREFLGPFDTYELLQGADPGVMEVLASLDDAKLLAQLGVASPGLEDDITLLKFVKSNEEKRAAEEIANRTPCADFSQFESLFKQVRLDLASGQRVARAIEATELILSEIKPGAYFVLNGQLAYVADEGEEFTTEYGRSDRRLRIVYDNETESANILARSFQKALHRDDLARRVTSPDLGPLFGSEQEADDCETGTIYVLRSQSPHPTVAANRELIHKIGVTGGTIPARIANANNEATYLLAAVDVVATYTLYNINRTKLEALIHKIFAEARLDLPIQDRFGHPVQPREWFLVPLAAIDEAVQRIRERSIGKYRYDVTLAAFKEKEA